MKLIPVLAIAASALVAKPAAALATQAAGGLGAAFGNTIQSTYPDGRKAELWLHPDASYSAEGRRHDRSSGHWKVKGEKVCLSQSHPIPSPFSYCASMRAGRIGASWSGKAVTGEPIRITLVRGGAA